MTRPAEAIAFPDIEALARTWLLDQLTARGNSTPVATSQDTDVTPPIVLIERTGGPRRNLVVDSPQVTLECHGPVGDEDQAAALTVLVRALIGTAPGHSIGGALVYDIHELSGPTRLRDTSDGHVFYRWLVVLDVRGHAI
jgi:hypothetical protein